MKKRLLLAVSLVLAVGALVVPLASSHDSGRITIGVRLNFAQPEAAGTFAACCAFTDSGTATAEITRYDPEGDHFRFEATNTFVGSDGSFTLRLRGVTGPAESEVHVARARWVVVGGTGAYAGMEGRGTLTAVTDQTTGELTAIDKGHVSLDD
jgi:hypothetical protein